MMEIRKPCTYATRQALVVLGVGVMLLTSVFGISSARTSVAAQAQTDLDHLKMLSGQEFEVDFISMMIQHHQDAIDMSDLAPDRALHQEVKTLAQNIITDQTREINQMTGWLQQWYNITPKEGMMHEMPGMGMSEMMGLQNLTGDAFDREFLTLMRMHHMGAVEMAQLVPERATHDELKTLAQSIISSQSAEIGQMEGWLKAWYGVDMAGQAGGATPVATIGQMPPDHMSSSTPEGVPNTGAPRGGPGGLLLSIAVLSVVGMITAMGVWLRRRAH